MIVFSRVSQFSTLENKVDDIYFEIWDDKFLAFDKVVGKATTIVSAEKGDNTTWLKLSAASGELHFRTKITTQVRA